MDPSAHRGKHTALDDSREWEILGRVLQNAEWDTPVTKGEIKDHYTPLPLITPIVQSNPMPYVNTVIFLDYIKIVLILHAIEFRHLSDFAAQDAVLSMDNFSVHVTDHVICLLIQARVCIIIFATHTTQIFTILNLLCFGVLKRFPRYELLFEND
jgi:hypothetical protein